MLWLVRGLLQCQLLISVSLLFLFFSPSAACLAAVLRRTALAEAQVDAEAVEERVEDVEALRAARAASNGDHTHLMRAQMMHIVRCFKLA